MLDPRRQSASSERREWGRQAGVDRAEGPPNQRPEADVEPTQRSLWGQAPDCAHESRGYLRDRSVREVPRQGRVPRCALPVAAGQEKPRVVSQGGRRGRQGLDDLLGERTFVGFDASGRARQAPPPLGRLSRLLLLEGRARRPGLPQATRDRQSAPSKRPLFELVAARDDGSLEGLLGFAPPRRF